MRLTLLVAVSIAASTVAAMAQNTVPIEARKKAFKAMGAANKVVRPMTSGDKPFELAAAKAALATFIEQSAKMKDLFPDDSKTGGETESLPVVWEKKVEFLAMFDKFAADAKAADTAIVDEASFKANWGKVVSNCGGCHKVYKKPD
jgi:cytochrome c556